MSMMDAHLLVDASVARSVGEPPANDVSQVCLSLIRLLEDKRVSVGAAFTPALLEEWKRHAPRMMISWLASMEQRGRIRRERDLPVRDLRRVVAQVSDDGVRTALVKDLHLSEAAIINGVPVVSRDSRQRRYLRDLSGQYGPAGAIQWVNPEEQAEEWKRWIESSCTSRDDFRVDRP